jgi:D-alanyl-D-alanine carboxypeptidase
MKSNLKAMYLVATTIFSSQVTAQTPSATIVSEIQYILDTTRIGQLTPGVVLSIHKVGEYNHSWGSGVRDLLTNTPANGTERFRIGSVTKNFTAAAILKLVDLGTINLSDPISQWLPANVSAVIPNVNQIKIKNLLNHTSGLADYVNDPASTIINDFIANNFLQVSSSDIMLNYFPPLTPTSLPSDSTWYYTNTGYLLLGKIIDSASGMGYKQFIAQVIQSVGLQDTYLPATRDSSIIGTHMNGYFYASPALPYFDITLENTSWANAAGEMISTAKDLNAYFKNLLDGNIISANSLNKMLDFQQTQALYGFGCFSVEVNGHEWFGHNGGIPGYNTNMFYSPYHNAYVSFNFNYEDSNIDALTVALDGYLSQTATLATENKAGFALYPTIANSEITLLLPEINNKTITIIDATGQVVVQQKQTNTNVSVDVSKLSSGHYFVHVEGINIPQRFIKM